VSRNYLNGGVKARNLVTEDKTMKINEGRMLISSRPPGIFLGVAR